MLKQTYYVLHIFLCSIAWNDKKHKLQCLRKWYEIWSCRCPNCVFKGDRNTEIGHSLEVQGAASEGPRT